ncbi:MAG TPA: TIGR03435 family protein [Bryobacteraceae bacterium]|nr:TIGR03435 family protein [Bryobacteraceae bacterium]
MIRALVGVSLVGCLTYGAFGQSPGSAAFEVASVKASKPVDVDTAKGREQIESAPGSLSMRNVSLSTCLQWAYDVKDYQVMGPSWMTAARYDILAKSGSPAPDSQMKIMLQSLLADRFQLTLHREKREVPVYALIQGKNPPKLHPWDENAPGGMKVVGSMVTIPKWSMAQTAELLSRQMDRPVIDMTGITGFFDLTVNLSNVSDGNPGREMDRNQMMVSAKMMLGRSLPQFVQEQLGLKLEARKLPADVLIIDHAEKTPTEN